MIAKSWTTEDWDDENTNTPTQQRGLLRMSWDGDVLLLVTWGQRLTVSWNDWCGLSFSNNRPRLCRRMTKQVRKPVSFCQMFAKETQSRRAFGLDGVVKHLRMCQKDQHEGSESDSSHKETELWEDQTHNEWLPCKHSTPVTVQRLFLTVMPINQRCQRGQKPKRTLCWTG